MIVLWFEARNSRVIGPEMRDPAERFCSSIKTTSFDWKNRELPYDLFDIPFFVRVTGALNICPFWMRELDFDPRFFCCDLSLSWEGGVDLTLLTATRMESPTVAYFDLPRILIRLTVFAPELSATFGIVCIWIVFFGMLELNFRFLVSTLWNSGVCLVGYSMFEWDHCCSAALLWVRTGSTDVFPGVFF